MELKSKKEIETNRYELEQFVSPEEFEAAIAAVFKRESKKLNIPGFRRGHAPRSFIEKYYGEEVFYEAALDHIYQPMVMDAVEKSELEVISIGEVNVTEIGRDKGVTATIAVVVKPEAKIADYKGMELFREPVVATEGDVDREIENVRERNSRMVTVEDRPAESGDVVNIDFDGSVDGVPFDGGKSENYELTLGAGQFIPGFEEQVAGHSTGEEFEINVTFPEDYHAEELKGKAAVFQIKLHEIKKKELPEVDDEFVKDVSEFDTLAEYRDSLKKEILDRREKAADADLENQLVEKVIEKTEAEIPQEMVENEAHEMVNSFAYRLQSQGLNLETYLKYTNGTTDQLLEQYRPQAENQVRLRLGLETIARQEEISVSDEEAEEEFQRLADEYGMPLESVKAMVRVEDLKVDVANRKVIGFLKENAKISLPEKAEEQPEEQPKKPAAPKKRASKKKTDEPKEDEGQA